VDPGESAFGWLVHFSRMMVGASTPEAMHPVLVEAAVVRLGVDAAAVLRVAGDRLVLSAARNLPDLGEWSIHADELESLGTAVIAAAPGFADSRVMMLVVGGNIYGAVVLLSKRTIDLDTERLDLAEAIVDLAAIATERTESYAALANSYSELKASREAFARSERLRVLGQMAAGVSHDVKNILNPLNLQLEIVRRRIARGDLDAANQTLEMMRDVIRHGVDVVDRLRAFSRQSPEQSESVDVERIVATATELSRPRIAMVSGIQLDVKVTGAPRIHARASELTTAIVNLIVNAIEAMPDGGTIRISAETRGGEVWIGVADNGPGMIPDVERNVFEPFFTTKQEGTGLGLAMIYAFVQRFTGRILLETAPGKGTTFTLVFPSADRATPAA
jgi:signal transduction histidine kinase